MFVCCSVAILYIVLPVVQGQANCSSFLHIPLLTRSQSEREEHRCDNCTSESYLCPPWYKPTTGGSCKFGAQVGGAVTGIGRGEKEDQVRPPRFLTYIHPSSHRDIGSHWAAVDDFCEGSRSPPGPSYRGREVHHLPPPEPLCGSPTRECSLNTRNHWTVTP